MTIYLHPPIQCIRVALIVLLTILLGTNGLAQNDLFISEYVESASDKCIEIYNPTNASISLDGVYRIRIGFNGNPPQTKSLLQGSIPAKGTHVVCTSSSSFSYNQSMGAVGHNGNDVIVLEKNLSPIDIVGNIGCDPGSDWSASGLSTSGMTLIRKGCITDGVGSDPSDSPCSFPTLASEWVGYPASTSHLGTHQYLTGGLTIDKNSPTFCGDTDGRLEIQAQGNGLEYSINGSAGPFSALPSFTGLAAGTYNLEVRTIDDPSCTLSEIITLDEGSAPSITNITPIDPTDCGLNDAKIDISASGNNLEYSIDNGINFQSGSSFIGVSPGTYDVLVQVLGTTNCMSTGTVTINSISDPVINSIDPTPPSDCGIDDGSITINGSPGGLEYSIDQGMSWSSSKTFSGLAGGGYNVAVRKSSAQSCRDEGSTSLMTPTPPQAIIDFIFDADCKGSSSGSISILASGGTGSYDYQWTGPVNIGNTAIASNLPAGIYAVIVSDAISPGCQTTVTNITVGEPSDDPLVPALGVFPDLCELNNSIPLSPNPSGITGSWSGLGVSNNQFDPENLQGTIELTFTPDPGICAQSATIEVEVIAAHTPDLSPIGDLCENEPPFDLEDGPNGINGIWTGPGVTNSRFDPSGLSGSINLTYEISPGECANSATVSFEVYALQTPELDPFPPVCEDGTLIELPTLQDQILGGWSGQGIKSNNTFDPSGLIGTIKLTFTPLPNQCAIPVMQNLTIGQGPDLTFKIENPSCSGDLNGTAEVFINGGSGAISVDWSSDGTGDFDDPQKITSLAGGNYGIQVQDQSGCVVGDVISLIDPDPLFISFTTNPESRAGAADGIATANVIGGTRPYHYLWDNGATSARISDLLPGNYTVSVTDDHGCATRAETIVNAGNCNFTTQVMHHNISCFGANDGWAEVTTFSGVEPISYKWSHFIENDTSYVGGLKSGSYLVTIEDAGSCQQTLDFEITQPDTLISILNIRPESSPASGDAQISVSTIGGIPSYQWTWSTGASGDIAAGLGPGVYSVTTTDANGCENIIDTVINGIDCNLKLSATAAHLLCGNIADGAIGILVSGGGPDYQYRWSHDTTLRSETATGLAAGKYSIMVQDVDGCIASTTVTIQSPPALDITLMQKPPSANLNDGVIESEASGGVPSYFWQWSTGANTDLITDLSAGTYYLTLSDANGCEIVDSLILLESGCDMVVEVITDSVSCFGREDGLAQLNVSGTESNFEVNWSFDPDFEDTIVNNLSAGQYSVTVTDDEGCEKIQEFVIGTPDLLRLTFIAENETQVGAKDGYIAAKPFGGTAPYRFEWNTGHTTDSVGRLHPGTYIISVEDSRGCTSVRSTIINPANCTLLSNVVPRPAACYGEASGRARLDITTLDFPVSIQWSHDSLLENNVAENLAAGLYGVTITDETQCRHTWTFAIEQPDSLSIDFEVVHQSEAGLSDGEIQVNVQGGTPEYAVFWSNDGRQDKIQGLQPGSYSVTIVDQNGCSLTDSVIVLGSDQCQLAANISVKHSGCSGPSGSIRVEPMQSRGQVFYRWSMTDIDPVDQVSALPEGIYWVEVQDAFCTIRDTVYIRTNDIRGLSYNLKQSICDQNLNTLEVGAVTGGTFPYHYTLDGIDLDPQKSMVLDAGTHIIQVQDSEGCFYEESFNVHTGESIKVPNDTTIKLGESIVLRAEIMVGNNGLRSAWRHKAEVLCQPCTSISVTPTESSVFTFFITDQDGCRIERKVNVRVSEQNLFYIPNAITPNYDNINDAFVIYDGKNLIEEILTLEIYDRRGVRVYHTTNLSSNTEAPEFLQIMSQAIVPQVYMYRVHLQFRDGRQQVVKGDFTLIN